MEDDPFPGLKLADTNVLDKVEQKTLCASCGRKRKYFCYSCVKYVNDLELAMPTVKLPIKIDIIKHKQELDGKSTAIHAALLAPEHCNIYLFPDIPDYNPSTDVVVFPSDDCISVEQWAENAATTGAHSTSSDKRTIIFIDCTWNQINPIISCPQLAGLQRIGMHSYTTKFWRPNGSKRDSTCLATIEAIYYFLREYHNIYLGLEYSGEYDNLLMIFKYMYLKIKEFHSGGERLKAYRSNS